MAGSVFPKLGPFTSTTGKEGSIDKGGDGSGKTHTKVRQEEDKAEKKTTSEKEEIESAKDKRHTELEGRRVVL